MKKMVAFILMFVLIFGITPAVFANPCCDLSISEITQNNDTVTVSYGYMNNGVTNREITLTVRTNDGHRYVVEESHFVSDYYGEGAFTFSSAELMNGYTYRVEVYYADTCASGYCSWGIGETQIITIQGGIPVLDYAELDEGKLELVGASTVGIKIAAPEAGFYKLAAVSYDEDGYSYEDWNINIRTFPDENSIYSNAVIYLAEGVEKVYTVSTEDDTDLSTYIVLEKYDLNTLTPLTQDLSNTVKLFQVSDFHGLNAISVPKYGVYAFKVNGGEEYEKYFNLFDAKGEPVESIDGGEGELLLEKGTYYINTMSFAEEYSLDITYTVPQNLEYGKVYSLEANQTAFYRMNPDKPSIVTLTGQHAWIGNETSKYSLYPEDSSAVLPVGEYFVMLQNYSMETQDFALQMQAMPSLVLDRETIPEIYSQYRYYLAFCAPADGTYEFDFSKCNEYYIAGIEHFTPTSFYTITLEKDEWVLISLYQQEAVTVRNYTKPTAIPLTFEQPALYDYVSGKTYLYSYTPETDGQYKIAGKNNYCRSLKIYTDTEVLYQSDTEDYSYGKILELKKDIPVYIELYGDDTIGGTVSQNEIKVTHAYTELTNGATISLSTTEDITMCYTISETGYYNVALTRTGHWYSAYVTVNKEQHYLSANETVNVPVYCEAGKKIYFTFHQYDGSWSDVTVNITKIVPTALSEDTEYSLLRAGYYSFTPSVDTMYEIAKDAYYASIHVVGTDEKNIVFTAEESSYFYGKAGMTYLLYPYENTAVTISKAECFSITENEINSASDTVKVFTFDVLEEGYYKIDTELSNAELYVWGGDAWNMVSGTFNHMYQLGKGIFPVVYQPDNEYEIGKYPASAAFTIAKCANNKTINATIEDCYISPEYGGLSSIAEIVVTAPQGTEKVTVGIEYTGPTGELESMTLQDLDFTNTDTQYLRGILYNMELGMTYKIKPYVYSNNDSRNKIYGEEKSYVMSMRKDLKTITHNSYSFETEGRSKYDQYGDMYYLTFVQPEDADTTTYLTLSSFLNIDLYDKDGNRLNLEWVSSLKRSAELKGGERYYLLVRSSADGKAEINVSSLPQASSVEVYSVRPDEILCTVTGNDPQSSVLYAAFYNGTQFLKVDIIENPSGDIAIPLDSALLAKQCKLILMDKTSFEPLCENELVEFTQSSVVAPM